MAVLSGLGREGVGCRVKRGSDVWLVLAALWFWSAMNLPAQTATPREYEVKAVFLFNFARFVEWPASAFSETESPLVIGVLGQDPFGPYLDETVRGEMVNKHRLTVERYSRVEDIKKCHILFIGGSEKDRLKQILAKLNGTNILTVGDSDDFARNGGMIRFVTEKSKIRLRINLEAVKAASLTISSKVLRPAEIVSPGKA